MFFALVDLVYAASLAGAPAETRATAAFMFFEGILPLWAWTVLWAGAGVACLVQAFMVHDRAAFVAESCLKVCWGSLYLAGWLIGEIPRGYVSAVIWLGLAGFVQVIASWAEPDRRA